MNWLVVVCALVVLFEFCVDLVKELVGCCVCFGCLLRILCGLDEKLVGFDVCFGCLLLTLC